MKITIDLQLNSKATQIPSQAQFKHWVATTLQHEAELTIRIVDEAEMAELNHNYRHKTGPTNILSFPSTVPEEIDTAYLGDLVICAPIVNQEATTQHLPPQAHWAHITVHGVLHLLGHDHIEPTAAVEMETLEIAILAKLGFANPYA